MENTKFFLNIVKHDLERLRHEMKLLEFDECIYDEQDREDMKERDKKSIKDSFNLLDKHIGKLGEKLKYER